MTEVEILAILWLISGVVGIVAAVMEIRDSHRGYADAREELKQTDLDKEKKLELDHAYKLSRAHRNRSLIFLVMILGSVSIAGVVLVFPEGTPFRREYARMVLTLNQCLLVVVLIAQRKLRRRMGA